MDDKSKGTKKTIADELLEDNFFKPPIDDVIEETSPAKKTAGMETVQPGSSRGPEESLLFDDFLKSPAESSQDEVSELTSREEPVIIPSAPVPAARSASPRVVTAQESKKSGSSVKLIVASVGAVVVVLALGVAYIMMRHPSPVSVQNNAVQGTQHVAVVRPEAGSASEHPAAAATAPQAAQPAPVAENTGHESKPPAAAQVAENVPPAAAVQPAQQAVKKFEVTLDNVRTQGAIGTIKRIGASMDKGLSFDVAQNKTTVTSYALYVDKVYPSEGEATADNLKLMVANISNASVVKADGGYRILIGKYASRARASSDIKNLKAAGLKELLKTVQSSSTTFTVKAFPFPSSRAARAYEAKVKRFGAKTTTMEMK